MRWLGDLLSNVEVLLAGDVNVCVEDLSFYADLVKPGWAYIACDTPWMNGHGAIGQAIARGATVLVVEKTDGIPQPPPCRIVIVRNSKRAYSTMCANFFSDAHRRF